MTHPTTLLRSRALIVSGAATLATLLLAIPASAHAELDMVTPADGSSVAAPPAAIVMTFTEPLDPSKSSIKLVNAGGQVAVEGSSVDATDARTMRLTVPPSLTVGTWTVRWISASALDGDLDHGTTTFTYAGVPSAGPSSDPSVALASPSAGPASVAPTVAASPPPSGQTPAASTGDVVIPVVAALAILAGLGIWLLRGRTRATR